MKTVASKKKSSRKTDAVKRKRLKSKTTRAPAKWSARVMKESDAMDLQEGVFKQSSGLAIAKSLKTSAERSTRRKSTPFRSAMSMLNFEINRGGTNLSVRRRQILNQAKVQLRKLFGRPPPPRS